MATNQQIHFSNNSIDYHGGDNISITKGVVSRVEVTKYAHSNVKLMTTQTDAAINSGNSGGPSFMHSKVMLLDKFET
ncbi:unnamed protein product [Brassica oleracea]